MTVKKVRKTRLAPTLRADSAAQPMAVPPQQYPFYIVPAMQCPECESGVQWETQALEPNPTGIGSAFGSCLSGSIGVACSRSGKRFRIPLLIAYAIEVSARLPVEDSQPDQVVSVPQKRRPWWRVLFGPVDG